MVEGSELNPKSEWKGIYPGMVFQLAPTEMIVGLLTPVASLYLGLMAWGYRA